MEFKDEEDRYAALCAYVLDEASPEERAAIEAALAGSAELRAQRDEIAATIGLVRSTLAADERLSDAAHEEVVRAAQTRRPRWRVLRTPWLAAAAGIAALAFGYAVYDARSGARVAPATVADTQLAKVERTRALDAARAKEAEVDVLERQAGLAGEAARGARAQQPAVEAVVLQIEKRGEPVLHDGVEALREEAPEQLFAKLGYVGDDTPTSPKASAGPAQDERKDLGYKGPGDSITAPPTRVSSVQDRTQPVPAVTGADNFFLGRYEGAAAPATPGPAGPGGASAGPAQPGMSGAGPAGPAAATTGGGAGGRFGNRGFGGGKSAREPVGPRYAGTDQDENLGLPTDEQANALHYGFGMSLETDEGRKLFFGLPPEERERLLELETLRILERCRRRPGERPRDMFFRFWGDNPFEVTALDAQSTFGVDVDTASYALVRNYLRNGHVPPREAVRTEEFVNYFAPDVPAPLEETFAIRTELAPSRFGGDATRWMLSVAVRAREVAREERKPLSLTFVVDTSGSMEQGGRLEMVKHALRLLVAELDGNDTLALVAFANEPRLVLPSTSAAQRGVIESAIHPLVPQGGTNAEGGLKMGYEVALAGLRSGVNNRVVLLSDGVANVGQTNQDAINADVARHRAQGVYLNTIGVGMENHGDAFLEQLADRGDGVCSYIDSPAEARRVLVGGFTGQFEVVARDVKVQVEFDPRQVGRWRLLGYENRAIADRDFRNDAVDAGEIGAGHQVVALYEIERTPSDDEAPLATVRLRWKPPFAAGEGAAALAAGEQAREIERPVSAASATGYEGASGGHRRAAVVAQFAELLRRSSHARDDSFDDLIVEAERLERESPQDGELHELVLLLHQSKALILGSIPACDELCQTIDEVRRRNLRQVELELLSVERDRELIDELARTNAELELRIRELVRRRYETGR